MKILVYDKFFDSFIKLPVSIQKKVMDFQKKFRENSESSAIHLEPIISFKDQTLRTARIDQKYRAILKVPEKGDAYLLLWVDNHDEAMAWAENKVFQWNQNTQTYQVFVAPEVYHSTSTKVDHEEKSESDNLLLNSYSDKQLISIGVPEILIPSVRTIADIADLEKMEQFLPSDVFENLFYLMDGADIDSIIADIAEGLVKKESEDPEEASINNQRNFIELTDDTLFNEALSGDLKKWKYFLHPSQRMLVEGHFNGPVKVTGGAGTGKTVAALHRLKFLLDKKSDTRPILFTTYTKALTKNLKELVQDFKVDHARIEIINIDALAFQMAGRFGLINSDQKVIGISAVKSVEELWDQMLESELVGYDKEFLISEYQDIILYHSVTSLDKYYHTSRIGRGKAISRRQRKEIWTIIEKYQSIKAIEQLVDRDEVFNLITNYLKENKIYPYSYVIADELQDFSNVELRFLRALVEQKAEDLFLVGDPLQKIYTRKINFSSLGIHIRGKRSRRLRINYRTSEEIKKLALSIIHDCQYDNFDGETEDKKGYISLFHGDVPEYKLFSTKNDELDFVLSQISDLRKTGVKLHDIVIGARTRSEIKDFKSVLHNNDYAYLDITGASNTGQKDGVRVSTFHSMKGLEFRHIFLVDVNQRTAPRIPHEFESWDQNKKEEYLKSEKSLLYVAASRAVYTLVISGVGNRSDIISI
jgi:superfamily I DNA/RNA helicase